MAIRVRPNAHFEVPEGKITDAIAQVGTMLKSLVRMQDITARLERDVFMIAFPGQDRAAVESIIERISGIVDCTAFESGDKEKGAFTISLETVIVEQMDHENSDFLIGSAMSELLGEPVYSDKKTA